MSKIVRVILFFVGFAIGSFAGMSVVGCSSTPICGQSDDAERAKCEARMREARIERMMNRGRP